MSSAAGTAPPLLAGRQARVRRPSTLTIWRWEMRKLISQKRTYLGLSIGVIFPLIFVVAQHLRGHHGHEGDNVFFSEITRSGLATPVLTLLLESAFLLPLAAAL